tara:strand:+ start:198 stop:464 length:267 start_codon:yes stop_codon:yes gene_type:complete
MNIRDNLPTLFIVMIVAFSFLMVFNHAKADPVEDINKVKTYVINEWNDTVEFQKNSWAQGKDQLARNKLQIQNLWNQVTSVFNKTESN